MKASHDTQIAVYLFIFFVAIYVLTTSVLNVHQFDVSIMRSEVVESIIERFDLAVPNGTGVEGIDGRDYSWFGLGSALLYLPFCIMAKIAGVPIAVVVSILNSLFGAATAVLVFVFCISLGYSRRASLYTAAIYGLGTMAWYYAKDPGDHVLETFFILLAVFSMFRFVIYERNWNIFISGSLLGIAGLVRPSSFMVVLPLILMLAIHFADKHNYLHCCKVVAKYACLLFFSLLPFVSIFLWYNQYRFGSIFEAGYSLIAARIGVDFFNGTPFFKGITGLLLSPGKGFFYYSPITILFFFSFRSFWKKHMAVAICFISTIVMYILFFAKNQYWHGDWAWGPRYLFVLTPFFIIPTVDIIEAKLRSQNNFAKALMSGLFLLSMLVQVISVSVNTYSYFMLLETEKHVKFTIAKGPGVQPIKGPVLSTYYDWRLSPILVQAEMIGRIIPKLYQIRNVSTRLNSETNSKVKISNLPIMNCLDFWWCYIYYSSGNRLVIYITPLFLLTFACVTARKLQTIILSLALNE